MFWHDVARLREWQFKTAIAAVGFFGGAGGAGRGSDARTIKNDVTCFTSISVKICNPYLDSRPCRANCVNQTHKNTRQLLPTTSGKREP